MNDFRRIVYHTLILSLSLLHLPLIDSAKLVTLLSLELELKRTFHLIHGLYAVFAKGVMNLYTSDTPPPTPSKVKEKKKKINYSQNFSYHIHSNMGAILIQAPFETSAIFFFSVPIEGAFADVNITILSLLLLFVLS